MAAILAKVFSLALRTVAKPLGNQFQERAMQHPVFRQNAITVAQVADGTDLYDTKILGQQMLHRLEVYITRGAAGKTERAFVAQMSDEKALEMAAKVVSEGFVFSIGVGVLTWEYLRGRRADAEKRLKEEQKLLQLRQAVAEQSAALQSVGSKQTELFQGLSLRLDQLEEKFNGFQPKQR